MKTLILAAAIGILTSQANGQAQQQQTVFQRAVFNGIMTPAVSAALPNIGQAVHIVMVIFPSASADVTGFNLRVEASFDNTTYFPISADITTATYTGSFSYVLERCNGVYPFVRLRYVTAASGQAMTANYTGATQPIGQIKLSGTRYITASPLSGATISGNCLNVDGNCFINGRKVIPILPSEWTSVNVPGPMIRTDADGFINMYQPFATDPSLAMLCRSISPPFDVLMHWQRPFAISGDGPIARTGIFMRESSTGKLYGYYLSKGGGAGTVINVDKWNNPGGVTSTIINAGFRNESGLVSMRMTANASTRSWSMPDPSGTYYSKIMNFGQAVLNSDFFTTGADQICFGFDGTDGNYAIFAQLVGFQVL